MSIAQSRLMHDFKALEAHHPEGRQPARKSVGIMASPSSDNIYLWNGHILGYLRRLLICT